MRLLGVVATCLSVCALAACGGGSSVQTGIPLKAVLSQPRTVTYAMPSSSMEPTIHCAKPAPGCQAVAADRVVVRDPAQGVKRGDVIAFRTPRRAVERCGGSGIYIKRVVGLPGETVGERGGFIYVDRKLLREPYVAPGRRDHEPARTWRVPAGDYFVLGDNRALSCDSRVWGGVPAANVIGKVVKILRYR